MHKNYISILKNSSFSWFSFFRLTKELAEFARAQVEKQKQEHIQLQNKNAQNVESDDDDIEIISENVRNRIIMFALMSFWNNQVCICIWRESSSPVTLGKLVKCCKFRLNCLLHFENLDYFKLSQWIVEIFIRST